MTEQSKTKKKNNIKNKTKRYNNQSKGSLLGKYDPVEHWDQTVVVSEPLECVN